MARQIKTKDEYKSRLLKLIPSEIVATYLFALGVVPADQRKLAMVIIGVVLFVMTPFYLRIVQEVKKAPQIIISTLSFAIWVYSLGGGGPFDPIYQSWIASLVLLFWTTFIPQFFKFKEA